MAHWTQDLRTFGHAQKIENGTWDISYSDNDFCFGDVWLDSVTIGGLTYDKQGVEAAKIASPGLVADRDSDGILGLSFSDENTGEHLILIIYPFDTNSDIDLPHSDS
ncbi:Type I transmembrane sorting receptor [Ascosphaera atra]|nr:Type I transmembrane sorting receptor [Ascosphaera atra]